VQECVEGLGACLESEREDEALREQMLEAIFAVYRFDVENGGFGLTRDIPPEFLQGTTPKEKHLAKNNLAAALEMTQLIFRKRPWFAEYQKMREISMELGNWEAVRQEALTFLETTNNISMLVEVALDAGDIERALQFLKATKPPGPEGYQY
jgi:hypothetical protein